MPLKKHLELASWLEKSAQNMVVIRADSVMSENGADTVRQPELVQIRLFTVCEDCVCRISYDHYGPLHKIDSRNSWQFGEIVFGKPGDGGGQTVLGEVQAWEDVSPCWTVCKEEVMSESFPDNSACIDVPNLNILVHLSRVLGMLEARANRNFYQHHLYATFHNRLGAWLECQIKKIRAGAKGLGDLKMALS